jgi:hypothetical protein
MTGVDRAETVTSNRQAIITAAATKQVVTIEATVSTDDTITLSDLTTINGAALLKRSDGSAITCTVATNVITITQATTTNVPVVGIVVGV